MAILQSPATGWVLSRRKRSYHHATIMAQDYACGKPVDSTLWLLRVLDFHAKAPEGQSRPLCKACLAKIGRGT